MSPSDNTTIMKKKSKYIATMLIALALGACTDNFESLNQNPYEIQSKSLEQDFNNIGTYYAPMIRSLFGDQIEDNLVHDSFLSHLANPTPFVGNRNNTNYYVTWNVYWGTINNQIMAPSYQVINYIIKGDEKFKVFEAWAKLIRLIGASRLSAYHGPVIYSNYGKIEGGNIYDSEQTLYDTWFAELDEILTVFNANKDYNGMEKFDPSFAGNISKWIKVANSWRLFLAMRISKVSPALAKTQGEKAISDAGGLIKSAADEWYVDYVGPFRAGRICFEWGDTRMAAGMESVLGGYGDPRVEKLFEPATNSSLYPEHPSFPYKGIQAGGYLGAKDDRLAYSTLDKQFDSNQVPSGGKYGTNGKRRMLMASDVYFTLAEASLRGWAGAGAAKDNYESGVKASFEEWGAAGVDNYLANDTDLPFNYVDPKDERNNWTSRMTVTVKWDEAASNEVKLDKIITQKWIASIHNNIEVWVDHRRTGYPKLPYISKNDSNSDWGVIPANEFIKRMPFVNGERSNNPSGVADATTKLGGADLISTRLWWDTGGPNF